MAYRELKFGLVAVLSWSIDYALGTYLGNRVHGLSLEGNSVTVIEIFSGFRTWALGCSRGWKQRPAVISRAFAILWEGNSVCSVPTHIIEQTDLVVRFLPSFHT